LPEIRVQPVLTQLRAGAKLSVTAFDHSHAQKLAIGELFAIDNQIDVSTGTVKLRASFPNDDEKLYPSQFVNAELHVDTLHDVVIAPQSAIQQGSRGPFTYVIKPDNTVSVRQVKLGAETDDRVVIEQGLDSGERVVIEGADKLREGASVALPRNGEEGEQKKPKGQNAGPPTDGAGGGAAAQGSGQAKEERATESRKR
jgi:multidrug efflux system membrane fusion protein